MIAIIIEIDGEIQQHIFYITIYNILVSPCI